MSYELGVRSYELEIMLIIMNLNLRANLSLIIINKFQKNIGV